MKLPIGKRGSVVQAGLDKVYLAQLRLISLIVGVYYFLITIAHFFVLDQALLLPVAGTSAATSFISLTIYVLVRRNKIPARQSHLSFIPVAAMASVTVLLHIILGQDEMQVINAVMLLYVFGFVTLSPIIFSATLLIAAGVFLCVIVAVAGEHMMHFVFMLLTTLGLSAFGFKLRYRTIIKSTQLLEANKRNAIRLAEASREIEDKMQQLQKANAAKDVFLANVTHELRTPLTGVIGVLDLLEDGGLDGDQRFLISTAQTSASYLLHIVNDLLDLSKLEEGKLRIKPYPVDLVGITQDAVETFRAAATAKNISLDLKIPRAMPELVMADGGRISQILLNLISNAIKFTDEGGVMVSLLWHPDKTSDGQQGCAAWHVADTGPGIPKAQVSRMFDRFAQLDNNATREATGTGLGLSIVQELLDLMGGAISAKSDVDKGAVFTVTLDLQIKDEDPEITISNGGIADDKGTVIADMNLIALVAEDNHVNQMIITRIMDRFGITTVLVENGQLAIEAVDSAKKPFDLIFMDVQMPVMDGVTATKIIKSHTPDTPIIAITANTGEQDKQSYVQAGMDGIIGKPIDIAKCRDVILRVLDKKA